MKKIYAIVLMAFLMAAPSSAQVDFGLKGGLNMTSMSGDKSIDDLFKNKAGFFVGPTVKFTLPIVGLAIDASALYDQREAKIEVDELSGGTTSETVKQQSIQIPINIRYGIGLGGLTNIYFFAGPQFGFNVGGKSKDLFGIYEWTLRSSNFSANVGLGLFFLNHLQLNVNYNIALGKTGEVTLKDGATAAWDTVVGKAKANAWQIALSYYF